MNNPLPRDDRLDRILGLPVQIAVHLMRPDGQALLQATNTGLLTYIVSSGMYLVLGDQATHFAPEVVTDVNDDRQITVLFTVPEVAKGDVVSD